ncbi:MAG: prephenate dehydrogenase/arogenate dehydrogenase family protein [Akkermansiaceae bacterium]|nr:prephenate dehydrogenase/arogenate dehydrogenase family protein [Akkermansiaceae bacterium]
MKRIAVLGSGLLGGSIALAVQSRLPSVSVALWGRREQGVLQARERGVKTASTDLKVVVEGAEMIVLASPVGAMLEILEACAAHCSLEGVLVTDVGSVKMTPRDLLGPTINKLGAKYIGSHPMAGSEQAGVSSARDDLFEGAACIITNDFEHSEEDVSVIRSLWHGIGCQCYSTTSEEHDRVIARISHVPHILASVGALVGLKDPRQGKFAGNGMRDTTRVASGHPAMWAEILMRNKEALREPVEEAVTYLREMLALLDDSSDEALAELLAKAKHLRDEL